MKVDLEKVRNMNDEELNNYLTYLRKENKQACARCYAPISGYEIFVRHNKKGYLSTRKLCSICENCYNEMINFLNVEPINWF